VDVKEEDLVYFTNLTHLDISDNHVLLSQLLNLVSLEVLDIQYNNLNHLQLNEGCFPRLHTLNLSYNKIPPSHMQELSNLRSLQILEMASNDLCTIPTNLSFFQALIELNLSSNNFSSTSVLVSPH
jgi:Leucine-rich repeat (LRR) protein